MDEILTIRDVAVRLKLGERTVTAMLGAGEIPGFKLRGQWRVRSADFDRWLARVAGGEPLHHVTADVLGVPETGPAPRVRRLDAPRSPEPGSGTGVETEEGISALSRRVPQIELHRRFIDALGTNVADHGPLEAKPFEARLVPPLPGNIRLYIFNATRPPGGRPLGEHKVQLIVPGQGRSDRGSFDQSGGRIVLLAGYAAEEDVFILWDAGLYPDFAWSRNVQVRAETIIEATAGKVAEQERRLRPTSGPAETEVVLACPPARLADALLRRVGITRDRMARS